MQYKYYYATSDKEFDDSRKFDDFLEAIQYMNQHTNSTCGIITAEIIDINKNEVVCSRRRTI